MCSFLSYVYALSVFTLAQGAIYTQTQDLPQITYDFIIVGAGAAGNVVASRLSENANFSILLVEAGISDEGILGISVPFLAPSNAASSVAWNYTTVPQAGLDDRVLSYYRGRVLGGSSAVNYLTYTRGSDDEYDRIANLTNDEAWSWNELAPYYLKSSKLVPPIGDANPTAHGNGPVDVSLPLFTNELQQRVIDTTQNYGSEFPYNSDLQSGNSVGVTHYFAGIAQSTIGGGIRSSSSTAYLTNATQRNNFDVLIQTTVTKLVSNGTDGQLVDFRQVEVAANSTATRYILTAKKEVILSAGSIGTPQILMLSGIGNQTALQEMNISTQVNLPDVGQHLQDHPILSNYFSVNSNATFDPVLRNATIYDIDFDLWLANKTGRFADAPASQLAFLRIPSNSSIFEEYPDPSAGPNSGHFEMIFIDGYAANVVPQPANGSFLSINTAVTTPTSRGSIQLASSDPFEFPLIDPAFFTTPFDRLAMVQAVKTARSFVATSPWSDFIISQYGTMGDANTDDEIISAAREMICTIWHPTSTAIMSPVNASYGVVDPSLRVKGTVGLRVIDASVFPIIPAAHTVAPVYIIAEKGADLIKDNWAL